MFPRFTILILLPAVLFVTGCNRSPKFIFTDQTTITFTNLNPTQKSWVTLGPAARTHFIQTVQHAESEFDPKLLELSTPMGRFGAGNAVFEYHLGLVVYRTGRQVHIWQNDFSHDLGDALLKQDDAWKKMLER